jgi:hypothetical protein
MLDGTPIIDIKPYLSSIPVEQLRRGWLAEAEECEKEWSSLLLLARWARAQITFPRLSLVQLRGAHGGVTLDLSVLTNAMGIRVACSAKRNQVRLGISAGLATQLLVMNF